MKFIIDNQHTFIEDFEDSIELLVQATSIEISYFTKQKNQRHPTKKSRKVNYYYPSTKSFPTGLLPRVSKIMKDNGIDCCYSDYRIRPSNSCRGGVTLVLPPLPTSDANYSFQEVAVEKALEFGRGLLYYPTGAGKTVIMARIIDKIQVASIIVVPNLTLLNQTYIKFCEYFTEEKVGKWGEGVEHNLEAPIVIATQQTLWSVLKRNSEKFNKLVKRFQALFLDECHHVAIGATKWERDKVTNQWKEKENLANTWWEVAMAIPAYYRFGMTATLDTVDNPNNQFVLESVTGRVVSSISVKELIDLKVLCPTDITMVKLELERFGMWRTQYFWDEIAAPTKKNPAKKKLIKVGTKEEGAYEVNILENVERNSIIARIASGLQNEGKRVLILVDRVQDQGKTLHKMIPDSIFLHGGSNKVEREKGVKEVKNENKILIGTIFKEGFDMRELNVVIIAGGGRSVKAIFQKIGRVLRVSPGKVKAQVFDFYDDDGSMCLKHSQSRLNAYEESKCYNIIWKKASDFHDTENCTIREAV